MSSLPPTAGPADQAGLVPPWPASPAPSKATLSTTNAVEWSRYGRFRFERGVPGFPDVRWLELLALSLGGAPQLYLRNPDAHAPILRVVPVEPQDRHHRVADLEAAALSLGFLEDDCLVFLVARRLSGAAGASHVANLRAPILLDRRRNIGAQVILSADYPIRFDLGPDEA